MTVRLYHGGAAQEEAVKFAREHGRMVHAPLGYELPSEENKRKTIKYLSTDEARQVVVLCLSTPVGSRRGTLVVGPMDRVDPRAADVLLKTIEDYDPERVVPVLWAFDLEGVRPTIVSRCHPVFTSGGGQALSPEVTQDARQAVEAALSTPPRLHDVIVALSAYSGKEGDILTALAQEIPKDSYGGLMLWERIRPLVLKHNPTHLEVLAAVMGLEEAA